MLKLRAQNMFRLPLYLLLLNFAASARGYSRYDFPPDFIFGAATSAYQVEGAAFEDGRTPSIFDTFSHTGYLTEDGDVACDQYHKYKEDVQLMVETGLDAYRFTISWTRLIPNGRGPVNPKGLDYYNNLINELISHGIEPHVTLMHFDLPQALEDEYQGFLSPKIVEDFTAYADVCFREFGDRVRHWTTINEANIFIFGGYDVGNSPPSRCSLPFGSNCTVGNSSTEPYLAAHYALLAHGSAARLYKTKYQGKQHGFIGLSIYAFHFIPLRNTTADMMAAQRSYEYFVGWFMNPLVNGDYPDVMRRNAGSKLPVFSKNESELVIGSFDFIGLNYYTIQMTKDRSDILKTQPRDYLADMAAEWIYYNYSEPLSGVRISYRGLSTYLFLNFWTLNSCTSNLLIEDPYPNTPWGLQAVLEHFKQVYNNPLILILENGQQTHHSASLNDFIDLVRVEYLEAHIEGILDAVRNGSNTKGYFVWSFLDTYELLYGYECSLGLYFVDFNDTNLSRYPKLSQKWYSRFLKGGNVGITGGTYQEENENTNILQVIPRDVDDLDLFL